MKANLGWPAVFGLLNVAYYVLHYMFASQVGRVCCMILALVCCMSWHLLCTRPVQLWPLRPALHRPQLGCDVTLVFWAATAGTTANRLSATDPLPGSAINRLLQTAHVGALYSAFLAMMITTGVPPVIAALSLGKLAVLDWGCRVALLKPSKQERKNTPWAWVEGAGWA